MIFFSKTEFLEQGEFPVSPDFEKKVKVPTVGIFK